MANVLKDKRNLGQIDLGSKKVIMVALQLCIRKMIPASMGRRSALLATLGSKHTYVLASPYSKALLLMTCFPFLHRLHLNVSCVSQIVSSLNVKSCRRDSSEKCLSASSFSSTTAEDSACLEACRWKIFSSMVPVEMNR